jgi:NADH dehydrogenase/NADH:ubiquinone oxidoreductase subunit G
MGSVTGAVVDSLDDPVYGARIVITSATSGSAVDKAATDLSGKFTLKLPVDTYYLSVVKDTMKEVTPFTVYAGLSTEVKVKLPAPPTGAISGIVLDLDGRPVPAAEIVAVNAKTGETTTKTYSSRDGKFGFRLPAGAYEIYAFKNAAGAKANAEVESGKTTTVKLQIVEKLTK